MAVRQYIGARYVPKFFDNPNGGSGWLPNVEYEPLTIVTYLGGSYTSKKPVPTNVGNPLENADYWAATGNYSQQIEEYREEVEEVIAKVVSNYTRGKHIAIIGDSNTVVFQNSAKLEELCPEATFDKLAVGGCCFIENNGNNLYNQIQGFTQYPDIIIMWCGGNDVSRGTLAENVESLGAPDVTKFPSGVDLSNSYNGAKSVIKTLRRQYPAAKIIGVIRDTLRWDISDDRHAFAKYFFHYLNEIYRVNRIPVICLDNYVNITRQFAESFNYGFSDGIHYTDGAMNYIATMIMNCIATDCIADTHYEFSTYFPPNWAGVDLTAMCNKAAWVGQHCYDSTGRDGGQYKLFMQENGYGSMCIMATDMGRFESGGSCRVQLRTPFDGDFYVVDHNGNAITSFNNVVVCPDVDSPNNLNTGNYAISLSAAFNWLPADWNNSSGELTVHKFPTNNWKYFTLRKNFWPYTVYRRTQDQTGNEWSPIAGGVQ